MVMRVCSVILVAVSAGCYWILVLLIWLVWLVSVD